MLIPNRTSHVWTVADQVVVSGCNFLIAILLARSLSLGDFGAFALAQVYLFYTTAILGPIVLSPMQSVVPAARNSMRRRVYVNGFFGYATIVGFAAALFIAMAASFLSASFQTLFIGELTLPLALALVGFQIQDWNRRALIALDENRVAFQCDLAAYGGFVVALVALGAMMELTPKLALQALAVAYSLPSIVAWFSLGIRPNFRLGRKLFKKSKLLSRDLLISHQFQWLASSGVILIGAGFIGQSAAGVIRVVQSALGPANVVLQWMENVIPVRAAQLHGNEGRNALGNFLLRCSAVGLLATLPALAVIAWFGSAFLGLVYGQEYAPFAMLLVLQGIYYLVGYQYRLLSYFFRTIGATSALPVSAVVWAGIGCLAAVILPQWMAESGVMAALLAGQFAAFVVLLFALKRVRNSSTDIGTTSYAVLRRKDGSPHLIIQTSNWRVVRSGLQLYYPSRWTGKAYKALLELALYLGVRARLVGTTKRPAEYFPALAELIENTPKGKVTSVAVLVGAPGPRTKCTARFMDAKGNPVAYGRVATEPVAVAALRGESVVLRALIARGLGDSVPGLLAERSLISPPGYMLMQSAGPDTPSGSVLTKAHFDFLSSLAKDQRRSWLEIVAEIENEVFCYPELKESEIVCRALRFLKDAPIVEVNTVVEHGDFAPWNIRWRCDGGIFVFDWEHSRFSSLPWLDAIHFKFQLSSLVSRLPVDGVFEDIRKVFYADFSSEYFLRFREFNNQEECLIAIYLIRSIITAVGEGKSIIDNCSDRLAMLDLIVK